MPLPASQPLTVILQISDGNGAPVNGADIRVEDGPVSLVRRLRRRRADGAAAGRRGQ